jgi:small GTP-binding protein
VEGGLTAPAQGVLKAVLIGDSGVGKTSLFQRLEGEGFRDEGSATVGGAYARVRCMKADGQAIDVGLWDTAGQERFRNIVPMYFQRANIVVVVYDVSSRESFVHVNEWMEMARNKAPSDASFILIGNKSDLEERDVTFADLQAKKTEIGANAAFETSAKSGQGIEMFSTELANCFKEEEVHRHEGGEVKVSESGKKSSKKRDCC